MPKDGPSAGVTLATALVSALTDVPVRRDLAMTGEITLRGRVLPIGGLKEKSMAAYRTGVKTVVIPADNLPDLAEIDPAVKAGVEFVPASELSTVFHTALLPQTNQPDAAPRTRKNLPTRCRISIRGSNLRWRSEQHGFCCKIPVWKRGISCASTTPALRWPAAPLRSYPPVRPQKWPLPAAQNVGKSSLLNKLLNRKSLARVSAKPGKTITINFYALDGVRLTDLPGYGYAKVAQSEKNAGRK